MNSWPALEFEQEPPQLAAFAAYLRQLRFPHRISESGGKLTLWVFDPAHIDWVKQQYVLCEQGQLPVLPSTPSRRIRWPAVQQYPLTLVLMLLSIAGFLVVFFGALQALSWLSFQGFSVQLSAGQAGVVMDNHQQWLARMAGGEWWRLLTPMFLHFDLMHLAFNLTMLGFFASQVERHRGSFWLLSHVLLISLVANCAQYLASDHLFGGMSGVNYGLIAYCAVINRKAGRALYQCPPGLFWVSVVMMLLGFFNLFSLFGYNIANWAHLGGFVTGLSVALLTRQQRESANH